MIPSTIARVDEWPLTATGKVDRRALPPPEEYDGGARDEAAAPRSSREEVLTRVWRKVLERDDAGIHDDFFRLGGDSILALRVVSTARAEGVLVTLTQLFRHRTPAAIAAVVEASPQEAHAPAGHLVAGPVPLTPIQRWFLDLAPAEAHHWNQSLVLAVGPRTLGGAWRRALEAVPAHHDALRLRLASAPEAPGGWRQEVAPPGGEAPFCEVDLAGLPDARREAAWAAAAVDVQASLDLERGPLLRLVLVRWPDRGDRLLFSVHHLGVDAVSWGILAADLETAYHAAAAGQVPELPGGSVPFSAWADRITTWASSPELAGEIDFWRRQTPDDLPLLPRDLPGDPEDDRVWSTERVEVTIDEETTRALVEAVPAAFGATVEEALLTGLAQTFGRWTGEPRLLVQLEGHGREDLFPDLDVARTVGWFTAVYPLLLTVPDRARPVEALKAVKERVRSIPRRGVGYGVLRWLSPDGAALADARRPEVAFNYFGRAAAVAPGHLLRPTTDSPGPVFSPRGHRPYPFQIEAVLRGSRLGARFGYSSSLHLRGTVDRLAAGFLDTLASLASHARNAREREHTPSDFPHARLDQRGLTKVSELLERLDDETS